MSEASRQRLWIEVYLKKFDGRSASDAAKAVRAFDRFFSPGEEKEDGRVRNGIRGLPEPNAMERIQEILAGEEEEKEEEKDEEDV